MTIIANTGHYSNRNEALVSVRQNKQQYVIVFNAKLVREVGLLSTRRVILDLEKANNKLRFIFTDNDYYNGSATFSLHRDGGAKGETSASRVVNINQKKLPSLMLGQYEPIIGKDDHIDGGDGSHVTITIKVPELDGKTDNDQSI